jgi:hypothetical protein
MKLNINQTIAKWIFIPGSSLFACLLIMITIRSFVSIETGWLTPASITLPKDIYMETQKSAQLIHVGKLKGEIDNEFESFHLAVDGEGQLYLNRNPEFSTDSLNKSKGWEPITRQQLETYQKQLHFIPSRKKGLKR